MTILLIENDTRHAEILCTALKAIDSVIECVTITNTEKAIGILNDKQILPQLILVDLMMPKMNGVQFYYAVKENPSLTNIPIWLMSSHIKTSDVDFFERAGIKIFAKQHLQSHLTTSVEAILKDQQSKPLPSPDHDTANDVSAIQFLQLQFNWK